MAGKASVLLLSVLPAVLGAPVVSQQDTLTKPAELSEPDFSGLSCIRIDHVEKYSITLVDFCPDEEVANGRCYCNSILAPEVVNREVDTPEASLGTRYGQGGWTSSPGAAALASSSDATAESSNTDLSDTTSSAHTVKVTVEAPEKIDVEVVAAENNEVKGDETSGAASSADDQAVSTVTVTDTQPVGSGLGRYKKIVSDDGTVILQFYDDMPRDVISAICRAEFEKVDRVEGCGNNAA
ncbi:hypothetical protein EX30DRAFT_344290 [Ascodesmis nigricans]|uniref:Uncharacterized protein n=1 Tax=Ascodesmis nigricans TaxID=341454 RepID=A0A4S2MPG3_9PEZI|nr:hypothetical protein EX30DRAFT_344290 [Ascodesmis nigricans]